MPFRTALSGLNAASAELRVIGNNVANASTTGFKKSRAEFADIFAASSLGVSSNAIGTGVKIASVSQQFSQGNIGFTDNNLDLAVSGQGFFRLNDGGVNVYTRAGQFGVDRTGYIVNNQNQRLTGFQADTSGNITGALGDLQLDTSDISPAATSTVDMALNLDASASVPAATATSSFTIPAGTILDGDRAVATPLDSATFTTYDSFGNAHTLNLQYTRTAGNTWTVELEEAGAVRSDTFTITDVTNVPNSITLNWDPDGAGGLQSAIPLTISSSNITGLAAAADGDTSAAPAVAAGTINGSTQAAFDPNNASTYNNSTSLTIFDSLGSAHLLTMYFRKTAAPNQWEVYTYSDGARVDAASGAGDTVSFSSAGTITTPAAPSTITIPGYNPGGGASTLNINLDVADLTQYGANFSVNSLVQDGFTTGRLSGLDVSDTGVLTARFTNGQSRTLAQVALANFSNAQGLRQLGDSNWAESFESGAALVGAPSTGSLGLIQSGALEGSNVDLTEQLVGMITAQRNFQANAQVITTADAITQTIINIR